MRMAVIEGDRVVNVIEAEEGFELEGFTLVPSDTAAPGFGYSGGAFVRPADPPATVPASITAVQGRLALNAAGKLAAVQTAVAAADAATQIWYEYATIWEYDNQEVAKIAAAIGLTDQQKAELFVQAAAIQAS